MADSPYNFINDAVASPYSQPFGSHFQQPSYQTGNPANQGFAPAGGMNSGNAILDMIINGIVRGLAGGTGLRTFGRPQTSDFASVMMRSREEFSRESMPAVLSSNLQLKQFGDLGKNRLFQQFVDQFASGGSLGNAFKTTYGRFGSTLGGPGLDGLHDAAKASMAVVRNLDRGFTDQNGMWQYGKTNGMNRVETIQSLDAYSRRFGGDQIVKDMALDPNSANKGRIESAQGKISGITEMVREAQNLFGPDKGLEELMDEVDNMLDGARGMTAGKVRDQLQRIQAVSAVVDMSNESMVRYMKVMDGLYKGMGYRGNNTASLAMNSLVAGKAIEDDRKARAEAAGEVYTGQNAQDIAQALGETQMTVTQSSEMMKIKLASNILENSKGSPSVLKDLYARMSAGDYTGANQLVEKSIKSGAINGADADMIYRALGMAEQRGGLSSTEESQFSSNVGNLDENTRNGITTNLDSPLAAAKIYEDSFLSEMESRGTGSAATRLLGNRAGELSAFMRNNLSSSDIKNPASLRKKLMAQFGISEAAAGQLTNQMSEDFQATMLSRGPGAEARINASWMSGEQEASYVATSANVDRVQKDITDILGKSEFMRDLNIGEEALGLVTDAHKTLSGGGKKNVTAKDVMAYFKATGQKFMGNEEYVKTLMDVGSENGGGLKSKLTDIKNDAEKEAKAKAASMGLDVNSDGGKKAMENIRENLIREKISGLKETFGLGGKEEGGKEDKENDKSEELVNKILDKIDKLADALIKQKMEEYKQDPKYSMVSMVENSSIIR